MKPELKAQLDGLVAAFATSDKPLETYGLGSNRILKGYSGKVTGIGFVQLDETSGANKVTRNQSINIPNDKGELVPTVVAYKDVDYPVVISLIMEDGRTIAINGLKQSALSKIDGVQTTNMVAKDWAALTDKIVTLDDTGDDEDNTIRRPGNDGKLEARAPRFFVFTTK